MAKICVMDPNKIIDQLGGSLKVAALCDVTVGAVSQWRRAGIPRARLMYLKAVRPDVFQENANASVTVGSATEEAA